jgi:hypothetical protein
MSSPPSLGEVECSGCSWLKIVGVFALGALVGAAVMVGGEEIKDSVWEAMRDS